MVCAFSGSLLIANPAICLQKTDRAEKNPTVSQKPFKKLPFSVSITDAKIVFYFETIF